MTDSRMEPETGTRATTAAEADFERFGYDDAHALGQLIVKQARARSLPIAVRIVFGRQIVFHAAMEGSSADNDSWLTMKINMVAHFGVASMTTKEEVEAYGVGLGALPHLEPGQYALAGGGVPLRVRGSLIGAVAVSGLSDQDDHDLVVESMHEYRSAVESR